MTKICCTPPNICPLKCRLFNFHSQAKHISKWQCSFGVLLTVLFQLCFLSFWWRTMVRVRKGKNNCVQKTLNVLDVFGIWSSIKKLLKLVVELLKLLLFFGVLFGVHTLISFERFVLFKSHIPCSLYYSIRPTSWDLCWFLNRNWSFL